MGVSWLWNDMITYDCRQKTYTLKTKLVDKDQMSLEVTASVFHRVMPDKIGYLHLDKGQDYVDTYIHPNFEGVMKEMIGRYTAQELNGSKREEAQQLIKAKLKEIFAKNFLVCDDVILQAIPLPEAIATAIIAKQAQDQKNLLAEKMKIEQENIAAANIAKSKGDYEAAVWKTKEKNELAKSASGEYLRLMQLENDRLAIEKWGGDFGTGNVFSQIPMIKTIK
jgi:regulator of protease activity HflC (stomatin/prohibitin superfamily)